MLLPHSLRHLFNGDILCLWEKEKHKGGHDQDPSIEEKEDAKPEETQH